MLQNAYQIGLNWAKNYGIPQNEQAHIARAFADNCAFLHINPDALSWRAKLKPDVATMSDNDIGMLAKKYFDAYVRNDHPAHPSTCPDPALSIVMQLAFGYPQGMQQTILDHQYAMCAENAVGSLLERYLDSQLRPHGWSWCCGDMVKAVDFIMYDQSKNQWYALQIKNRDNSENSSSSAIRNGTTIEKWFRTFSKRPETNWHNVPHLMQGYGLSEENFIQFLYTYLR